MPDSEPQALPIQLQQQDGKSHDTDASQASQTQQSELDRLVQEAEDQAATQCVDHPKPCVHVAGLALTDKASDFLAGSRKCPTCLWWFCENCASHLDPAYCKLCLTEKDAEIKELPLVGDDGVTHEGRILKPADTATFFQPRFGTLAKTISEMRDFELEDYIKQYKNLVQQAEKALDFRRVVLGASQVELEQRKQIKQRRLAADKSRYPINSATDKTTSKQTGQAKSTAPAMPMADILKALETVMANKTNKNKKEGQ